MNEKLIQEIKLPDGWEEVSSTPTSSFEIPEGWEEVTASEQNVNPFVAENTQGVDFSQVQPQELKQTAVLTDYEEAKKPYLQQLFDKTVARTKEALGIAGSAAQDVANIVAPIGEVNFMGENYDNPLTGVKGNKSIADTAIEQNDLPLQAYNDINQLARTDLSLFANEKNGKDTYNENLANIVIDKFGFDDLGIGEDGKYYATKGDNTIQLNKDTLSEITSSIYGDKMEIVGSILGAKTGYDVGKNFGTKGKLAGSLIGGAAGAAGGTLVDMLDSIITNGEKLNATQIIDEASKSAALDAGAGLITAGVVKAVPVVGKAVADINPFTVEKRSKAFIDEMDNLEKSGTPISKEDITKNAQEFGGNANQTLTQQANFQETKNTLASMYDNNKEAQATLFADNEALTSNLYNKLNIPENVNDKFSKVEEKVASELTGNIKGIQEYWDNIYSQTKDDILKIAGNENIPVNPKVMDEINRSINSLKTIENVQGKNISKESLNEFERDFASMLDAIQINLKQDVEKIVDGVPKIVKEDVDSYTLSGMMDLQRKFNDFYYKHSDKFTRLQKENLGKIKGDIYGDIENYITTKFDGDTVTANRVKENWAEINADYGTWVKTKGKSNIVDGLASGKLDATDISKGLITAGGDIDVNGLKLLGDVAFQLGKTNPEKLEGLYGSIVNNMLNDTMIRKTVNNADVRVIDFEKFNKAYDNMPRQVLNQVFGQTSRGKEIVDILDNFRQISKHEADLQQSIIKKGSVLSEADRTAKERTRDFLFGVGYAIRHRIVGAASKHFSKSEAYHHIVLDMAKQRRYGLKEFDESIQRIESNKTLGFSKDEVKELKNIRKEVYDQKLKAEAEESARLDKIEQEKNAKIREEELTKFYEEQKQRIDAQLAYNDQRNSDMALNYQLPQKIESKPVEQIEYESVYNEKRGNKIINDKVDAVKKEMQGKIDNAEKSYNRPQFELEKQLEELKKSPYFDEVVFNGQNTYAKDARNAQIQEGDIRYEKEDLFGQGNENGYNKIDASYVPNEKFGTVFTKQDYNNLQAGKIDETLVNKIKMEIAEREHGEALAKDKLQNATDSMQNIIPNKNIMEQEINDTLNYHTMEVISDRFEKAGIKLDPFELKPGMKYSDLEKKYGVSLDGVEEEAKAIRDSQREDYLSNNNYEITTTKDPRSPRDLGRRIENMMKLRSTTQDPKMKNYADQQIKELLNRLQSQDLDKAKNFNQSDSNIKEDLDYMEADKNGSIPFSNPVAGGGAVGAASGTQTDYNQDGKVDEIDVAIGAAIGAIGIKATMKLFPTYFK
jgi:hypothetical protein